MKCTFIIFLVIACSLNFSCKEETKINSGDVIIENDLVKMIISADATAKNLVFKPSDEECPYLN